MEDKGKFREIEKCSEFNALSRKRKIGWTNYIQKNGKFKKNFSSSNCINKLSLKSQFSN